MPRRVRPARDARAVALDVLVRVETEAAFADRLLGPRLEPLSRADRALASELVYGTLAWQGRLDHHLGQLVRGSVAALDPPVRAALRLGLYQLLFLDRVPAYAAVDASVRLARRRGRGAAGLVNAVLRRAAREASSGLPLPNASADPIDRLAVEWSHPRWLVARLADEIGLEELPALLAAHNRSGEVTLRVNQLRTTQETLARELAARGIRAAPARWADGALALERGAGALRRLPQFRDGHFAFQGEASQLVTLLLGIQPGSCVLDACAAPGGKTVQAAAAAAPGGRVVALDLHAAGVRRIAAEAARLGLAEVGPLVADARRPPLRGMFDAVLVDAPCSGLGTLRRHPELRWRRGEDDLARLAILQGELLAGAAPLVRPGGTLVYAVCSPMRTETDDVIARFLADHRRFARESAAPQLPARAAPLVSADGALRTWPHRHDLDGFFAMRLRAR
jgi:16S rRNA (cytosine967-C5)-methyltransferase